MHTKLIRATLLALALSGGGIAAAALTAPAVAADATVGGLTISGAFARATLPRQPVGGAYLTITNTGTTDDRLVSVATPVSDAPRIDQMQAGDGGTMKMAALPDGLPIPAGQTVTLAPGSFHVMLTALKQPLVKGETLTLTLIFEKAGAVELQVPIAGPADRAPPAATSLVRLPVLVEERAA